MIETSNSSDTLTKCADGSFCCDYSDSTCCNDGKGIKLSPIGSSPSSSATSTSSLSATGTSTVTGTSTTARALAAATTASTSAAKSSNLAIGLGVGLGLGALVIAGAGGLIWYLRSPVFLSVFSTDYAHRNIEYRYQYDMFNTRSY